MLASEAISLLNTALLTVGSTAILLYQRKAAIDREIVRQKVIVDAEALAMAMATTHRQVEAEGADTRALIHELHARLDKVVPQRNHLAQRVETLEGLLERARCLYPRADGSASCVPGRDGWAKGAEPARTPMEQGL